MSIDAKKTFKSNAVALAPDFFEPIAIVGMSCRFPEAANPSDFWKLLKGGKGTVQEISKDRWDIDNYYDADRAAADKTNQKHGSFLSDIHGFDPFFFNISPAEAQEMNPSQKLMLELAWEAVESSSVPYDKITGQKVGVYMGNIWSDFEHYRKHKNAVVTSHSAMGQSANVIANRISYNFGFKGPSLVVDTGCSSALVALHLAIQSLRDGSIDYGMAGGINHILDQDQYILLTKFGGLSSKGKCSTFDSGADGFVRGEGAGNVLLKRLSDAERDGDRIYAVIKGSAVNNNGFNKSLPATSVEGQKEVLAEAYRYSGIAPSEVHYVEAHGTGTRLGDPTEARALGEFFGEGRENRLHIGSVKTNIGHLEGAAGIAGLIKVVVSMQHRELPKNLNYKTPNPEIAFDDLKLKVQTEHGQWPTVNGESLKAGVNSFGWGGTNAHIVLEEYRAKTVGPDTEKILAESGKPLVLPLSAKSSDALKAYAKAYLKVFEESSEPEEIISKSMATALNKPTFEYRKSIVAKDGVDLMGKLKDFVSQEEESVPANGAGRKSKIAFIFPGQGSQWLGMGKGLYADSEVFKEEIDRFDAVLSRYTDWSLVDQIHAGESDSRLEEINVIQPAICAIQIALARLWQSWGIEPDTVVGHSMGEIAAAYIAGVLSADDAAKVISSRSALMKTMSGKNGGMAVTELTVEQAQKMVKQYPKVSIAVNNSPKSTVLSGDGADIDTIIATLDEQGLFAKRVKVDVASHSSQMNDIKKNLGEAVKGVCPKSSDIKLYSTCRGTWMPGEAMTERYWVDNLRNTVKFASAMESLIEDGHTVFIEVSPHPVLATAMKECLEHHGAEGQIVPSMLRNKPEQTVIHNFFGELLSGEYMMDWKAFYGVDSLLHVDLPSYPFQRDTYQVTERTSPTLIRKGHPLLGRKLSLAGSDDVYYWEATINTAALPYLKGHQVNNTVVLPGCAYFEMALQAANDICGEGSHLVKDLRFIHPVSLGHDSGVTLQVKVQMASAEKARLVFYSKDSGEADANWLITATAILSFEHDMEDVRYNEEEFAFLESKDSISGEAYYREMLRLGLQYQGHFQSLQWLKKGKGYAQSFIKTDDHTWSEDQRYILHPALMDSCFQTLFANVTGFSGEKSIRTTTYLSKIEKFQWIRKADLSEGIKVMARIHTSDKEGHATTVGADLWLCDIAGKPFAKVSGITGKVIETGVEAPADQMTKEWIYKVDWETKKPEELISEKVGTEGSWLIFGGTHDLAPRLASQLAEADVSCQLIAPKGAGYAADHVMNDNTEEAYRALFTKAIERAQEKQQKITGIIHASSVSSKKVNEGMTPEQLEEQQQWGSISLLHLLRALSSISLDQDPKVALVTGGVLSLGSMPQLNRLTQAPLWGLGKVMANEFPQYNCLRVDLSASPGKQEVSLLVRQLTSGDPTELEVAIRKNTCYVPRLRRGMGAEKSQAPVQFSKTGTYLVTGYRGLGMEYIKWMFAHGARNFALLSRSGRLTSKNESDIKNMVLRGARFVIYSTDVSNHGQVSSAILRAEKALSPIKGVIHAAGLIAAKPLIEIDTEEYLRILSPKVKGAWNLHLLTQDKDLDCFVMFSSTSVLLGLSGQGSYVSANTFLDILAQYRHKQGLPVTSINWGVMKDVGMVADDENLERYASAEGFIPVTMKASLEVMGKFYHQLGVQIGIQKMDAEQTKRYYPALGNQRYFQPLLKGGGASKARSAVSLKEKLSESTSDAQSVALIENYLIDVVAQVIKAAKGKINSAMTFKGLGVDSLMAVQLRNLLKPEIPLKLSVAKFWEYPSIREYAQYLFTKLADTEKPNDVSGTKKPVEEKENKKWFVVPSPDPDAKMKLFCFHDAGGSASLYDGWEKELKGLFEVNMVELPGRGNRFGEQFYEDINDFVKDFVPALISQVGNSPYVFFGHSMGGLLLFETTKALRDMGMPLPDKIYTSSTPQLESYNKRDVDHNMPEEQLVKLFPHLDKSNITDDELRQILMETLRADLKLINSFVYSPSLSLGVPITSLRGVEDTRVTEQDVMKWEKETSESFEFITRSGGHRYIENDGTFLRGLLIQSHGGNEAEFQSVA